jgi:hypothetical protein
MNTPARKIVELKINEDGWWTVTSDVGTGRIDIGAMAPMSLSLLFDKLQLG